VIARVVIQTQDFNVSQVLDQLRAGDLRVGAICSFVGTVRDTRMLSGNAADQILSMELEHYPGMTESSIEAMIDEAHQRFDFYQAHVIHLLIKLSWWWSHLRTEARVSRPVNFSWIT
jgi:molybdopterin synthase catalytic subunit